MIKARAHAKVNLYLVVHGRRSDGYHEVETVLQSVDLADEIAIRPAEDIQVTCSVPELAGPGNLAHKAAEQLRRAAGVGSGASIAIDKHIPVAAGLAGGSADAAAALVGLNLLWDLGLPLERLIELGAGIGADVPFCIIGGTALGTGTGAVVSRVPALAACHIVLAKPAGSLSASEVYAAYDRAPVQPVQSAADLLGGLDSGDLDAVCRAAENALEDSVVKLMPRAAKVKQAALAAGASCALVSGSGPTVFALAQEEESAERVARAANDLCEFVRICRPVDRGVELL